MQKGFTFVILKPDLMVKGLLSELAKRLTQEGLKIARQTEVCLDLELNKRLYQWDMLIHPKELEGYLCKGPLNAWIVEGDDAVAKVLKIKRAMRVEFGRDILQNLLHCPDSEEDFLREYALLFPGQALRRERQ